MDFRGRYEKDRDQRVASSEQADNKHNSVRRLCSCDRRVDVTPVKNHRIVVHVLSNTVGRADKIRSRSEVVALHVGGRLRVAANNGNLPSRFPRQLPCSIVLEKYQRLPRSLCEEKSKPEPVLQCPV